MTETTDANDTDAVGGLDAICVKGVEDGSTTAHEGRSVDVGDGVGNLEEVSLPPDAVRGEAALVEVGVTVHGALGAVGLAASEAEVAGTAGVVLVSPSDAVALLHVLDSRANLLDDTGTLVSESHVGALVVLICAAETGGSDLDEDLVVLELALVGLALDNLAVLGALENGERRHVGDVWYVVCDVVWCSVWMGIKKKKQNF